MTRDSMSGFVPSPGDPSALFERVRDYVGPYAPDVVARCAGATDEQLAAYARRAGFASPEVIPASYRSFLHGMGADDGGLLRNVEIEARVDDLLEFYDELSEFPEYAPDPKLPVAARYTLSGEVSFDLRDGVAPEPALADTDAGRWFAYCAQSWEALVMRAAVLCVEVRRLPNAVFYGSSRASASAVGLHAGADTLALVDAFAARHGLAPVWPSDAKYRVYVGERDSVVARSDDGGAGYLRVFAADDAFPTAVARELAPQLGVCASGRIQLVGDNLSYS